MIEGFSNWELAILQIGDSSIKRSSCEKLLAVSIDSKPNMDDHVKTTCSKANNKLGSLS